MSPIRTFEIARVGLVFRGGMAAWLLVCLTTSLVADESGEDVKPGDKIVPKTSKKVTPATKGTHKQAGEIKIRSDRSGHQLQTFCLDPKGNILAVVAPPRTYGGTKLEGKNNSSEIRMFDGKGESLREWSVDFAVQAIAVAPNGTIFVSGNGKIAKFDSEGKELASVELPHISKLLSDSDAIRERAQEQLNDQKEQQKEQFETRAKDLQDQVEEKKRKIQTRSPRPRSENCERPK
jgi:hypothetical protein